jgi:hypothetical protein
VLHLEIVPRVLATVSFGVPREKYLHRRVRFTFAAAAAAV